MFGTLLSWLTGGAIAQIGKQINQAYQIRVNAKNDEARIDADKHIAQLQAQQAVLIAEQGHWLTRWIRPALAAPVAIYWGKVLVYDKCLGLGATPDLSTEQHAIMGVIVGSYFLTRPFEKVFRK